MGMRSSASGGVRSRVRVRVRARVRAKVRARVWAIGLELEEQARRTHEAERLAPIADPGPGLGQGP